MRDGLVRFFPDPRTPEPTSLALGVRVSGTELVLPVDEEPALVAALAEPWIPSTEDVPAFMSSDGDSEDSFLAEEPESSDEDSFFNDEPDPPGESVPLPSREGEHPAFLNL